MEKIKQLVKNPKTKTSILLAGIFMLFFGSIGFSISNAIIENSSGEAGPMLSALIVILSVILLLFGGVLLLAGAFLFFTQKKETIIPFAIATTNPTPLQMDQRREILQREVNKYLSQGYRVVSQTDTTAQLVKPKQFSCLWFTINAILIIGWIFYLLWYWSKRDQQVYIEVDGFGNLKTTR